MFIEASKNRCPALRQEGHVYRSERTDVLPSVRRAMFIEASEPTCCSVRRAMF